MLKQIGTCPKCGSPIRAYVAAGKRIILACGCESRKLRERADRIRRAQKACDVAEAEKAFLDMAGERFRNKTFRNYHADKDGKDKAHLQLIHAMYEQFDKFLKSGMGGLVLGSYGCGKTHLEVALGRALIRKGYSVRMYGASELYDKYMAAFSWKLAYSPQDVIEDACHADLLILDDVGVNTLDTDRDNFAKFFYGLINYRYKQKKPLLMSTNLQKSELVSALTPRVYDRILGMTYCVVNKSSSKRQKENKL